MFLTDSPYSGGGSAQFLEVCHRGHATVEDHIRSGKTTSFGRFPSRDFGVNGAWLEPSLAAIDLLAWTRVLLLDGELATAEPKNSATGYCTSPPASPAAAGASTCAYRQPGPGGTNWPQPSTASPHCPDRQLTGKPPHAHDPKGPGEPDHRAGTPPCPTTEITPVTQQLVISDAASSEPKRRG